MVEEIGRLIVAAIVGGLGTWAYEAHSRKARRGRLLLRFRVEIAVVRELVQEIVDWSKDRERSMPWVAANLGPMVGSWRRRLRPIVQELPELIDADGCAGARLYEEALARCHGLLKLAAGLPPPEADAMRDSVAVFFSGLGDVLDIVEDRVLGLERGTTAAGRQPQEPT